MRQPRRHHTLAAAKGIVGRWKGPDNAEPRHAHHQPGPPQASVARHAAAFFGAHSPCSPQGTDGPAEALTNGKPKEIPRNVVTLNSRVALRNLDSGHRLVLTVADPHDATPFGDRLSVAGPAGTALLGKRVGQIVHWKIGSKKRRFRVEQVLYQPEAAGDFDA